MDLSDYRAELDRIDSELVRLFAARMDVVGKIAAWKQENDMQVYDRQREQEKLLSVKAQSPEELREDTAELFTLIMKLSRRRQNRLLQPESPEGRE